MSINLSSFRSIQSNLFVKINTPSPLLICDRVGSITLGSVEYTGVGELLGVTSSQSELRVSGSEVSVTISGIDNSYISEIIDSKIKGSEIQILRALFDGSTGNFLNITGNPVGRFRGFVNNISFQEEWDNEGRVSSNTLLLVCTSVVTVLENKISGRRTNPTSMKKFFSDDVSMDRVPSLENAVFDFGEKK